MGRLALGGEISWREVSRRLSCTPASIKNHMEKHLSSPVDPASLVATTIEELAEKAKTAPIEVRPFYVVAIENLKRLDETKPSQQHLISALKAVHEVTGMKLNQRMLLEFAAAAFPGSKDPEKAIATYAPVAELEVPDEDS